MRILDQAARSIGSSARLCVSVHHPSTLHVVICPAASSAHNNMAAVSAEGNTVWVLIRRLNSSWSRSIALGGTRTLPLADKQPGEGEQPVTGLFEAVGYRFLHLSRHLRMKARRRTSISAVEVA